MNFTQSWNEYWKTNEGAFNAENEIISEKLALGINGLEWLVLQKVVDEDSLRSLEMFKKHCERFYKLDFNALLKDAFRMDPDSFYDKYKINWWITIDDGITSLALLKERDYDRYFEFLQWIYEN